MKAFSNKRSTMIVGLIILTLLFSAFSLMISNIYVDIKSEKSSNVEVSAAWEGEGSEADPFLMKDAEDIITLSENLNKQASGENQTALNYVRTYFALANNIDFSGETFYGIGVECQVAFMGNFDGRGYTIKNISCSLESDDGNEIKNYANSEVVGVGFFGLLGGEAVVKNLRLVDCYFYANNIEISDRKVAVGCIAGVSAGSKVTIENCQIGDPFINGAPSLDSAAGMCSTESPGGYEAGIVGFQYISSYSGVTTESILLTIKNCEVLSYYGYGGYSITDIGPSGSVALKSTMFYDNYYSYLVEGCLYSDSYIAGYKDGEESGFAFKLYDISMVEDEENTNFSATLAEDSNGGELYYRVEQRLTEIPGLSFSYAGGKTGTPWYRAQNYKHGLPRLRIFMEWKKLKFKAVNGKVSLEEIQVPKDVTVPTTQLSTTAQITILEQVVVGFGSSGYRICEGWTYTSSNSTYTVTFSREYYYLYFNDLDGTYKPKSGNFETGTTKIKIYYGDPVNLKCLHTDSEDTIIQYQIGSKTVKYNVPKEYIATSYGSIVVSGGENIKAALLPPIAGTIEMTLLERNYDKLEPKGTYYIEPTIALKNYGVEVL